MASLLVDVTNIAFATRFAKIKTPANRRHKEKLVTESIARSMINWILNTAQTTECDSILIAGDGKRVWRRDIYPDYKASRTTDEDVYYGEVLEAIGIVCDFFAKCTSAYVITVERVEADDIIAFWTQNTDEDCVIMSTDRDFIQLISDKVKLYSPVAKEYRETADAQFDLFVKCFRGDKNDCVPSAYPRVRESVLKEAWEDDLKLLNILETVLKDGEKVGDKFMLNQRLIDLTMQPDWVKNAVKDAVADFEPSQYREIPALKWFREFGLGDSDPILKHKEHCLKKSPVWNNK